MRYRFERGSRYYEFFLQTDLLGDLVVTVVNGRIGTALGNVRHLYQPDMETSLQLIEALREERLKKQYKEVVLNAA